MGSSSFWKSPFNKSLRTLFFREKKKTAGLQAQADHAGETSVWGGRRGGDIEDFYFW